MEAKTPKCKTLACEPLSTPSRPRALPCLAVGAPLALCPLGACLCPLGGLPAPSGACLWPLAASLAPLGASLAL